MDITNKTRKPLSLPLPGGKKLFLGPGKTGQVSPKALEFAPLAKLLEAGEIAVSGGGTPGAKTKEAAPGRSATPSSSGPGPKRSGAMRQSGDR